ncbi:MAG: hypothetical protein LBV33_06005 [Lachnospiraceae bacterium]|nr:hypothetical protein [Lachnospiraceae bacterium]
METGKESIRLDLEQAQRIVRNHRRKQQARPATAIIVNQRPVIYSTICRN